MKFKTWLEDATSSGSEFGNEPDPHDNCLKRPQYYDDRNAVKKSEKATKLFGLKFMSKKSRKPLESSRDAL